MTTWRIVAGTIAAVIGAASGTAFTDPWLVGSDVAPAPLREVSVQFALEAHARLGPMAALSATLGKRVAVGQEMQGALAAGTERHPDICMVWATHDSTSAYLGWKVRATVRAANAEQVELDLSWSRTTAGEGVTDEGTRTVTLKLGQSHLIDVASAQADKSATCSHVTLRVAVNRQSPISSELLVHRIWMVHERGTSRWVSEPVEAIGAPGDAVAFRFRPLRWTLLGSPADAAAGGPLIEMDVRGTVTTDPGEDGRFETMFSVRRETLVGPYSTRGGGTLLATVRAGEASAVELPTAAGSAAVVMTSVPSGTLAPGLSKEGGLVRIDVGVFYAGSRTSLVMTVDRLR
jgi:hypothetical protein